MNSASIQPHKSRIEQLRKPVSFLVSAILLAVLVFSQTPWCDTLLGEALEQVGFLMVFFAVLGRVWCTLFIAGRKNRELCTSGPYELCRNPLYLFSFIGLIGIFFAGDSILLAILGAIAYCTYYHGVIRSEEHRLAEIFGSEFDDYVASAPRFWPRLIIPKRAHTLQVDSQIFTRSLREVFWFLFAIVLTESLEWLKQNHLINTFQLPL